jgi:hypothetical protein
MARAHMYNSDWIGLLQTLEYNGPKTVRAPDPKRKKESRVSLMGKTDLPKTFYLMVAGIWDTLKIWAVVYSINILFGKEISSEC